jgi:hypothetical protein
MLGRSGGEMMPIAAEPVSFLQSAEPTLISRELIRTSIRAPISDYLRGWMFLAAARFVNLRASCQYRFSPSRRAIAVCESSAGTTQPSVMPVARPDADGNSRVQAGTCSAAALSVCLGINGSSRDLNPGLKCNFSLSSSKTCRASVAVLRK